MNKVRRMYHQKYREDWEKFPSFADWLCRGEDGFAAHCKICDANVLARLASIKQHNSTAKHQKALKAHQFMTTGIKEEIHIKEEPQQRVQKYIVTGRAKPKRPKVEQIVTVEPIGPDTCSNDSILEDLLGDDDDMEQEYLQISEQQMDPDIKAEAMQEFKFDEDQDDCQAEDNIISEFDLFGKSVSLQLNHMELEDALLCQERLQVVLTEFRLKILKRKSKRNF